MMQEIFIGLVFLSALAYLGRLIVRMFQARHSCESGCGKCGAIDFEKIEKQINAKLTTRKGLV